MRRTAFNVVFGSMLLAASAATAFAQQPTPSPASPAKPGLIVEEIQNGWLFSPDVRATDLDGKAEALAGGYLGRITDRSWVVGVGGYMLTNPDDDRKLWYGGPVFEWLIRADRKIGFGVRTLVGVGSGTLARPLSDFVSTRAVPMPGGRDERRGPNTRPTLREVNPDATIGVQDDFFVAEPQINVMWNITAGQRIVFGVGYRAVGNAPYLGDDLRGVSGSIAFQLGGK
jgi:hypothetical protein